MTPTTNRIRKIAALIALAVVAGLTLAAGVARGDQPPHRAPPPKAANPNKPAKVQELLTRQDQDGLRSVIEELKGRREPLEQDEVAAIGQYLQTRLTRSEIPESERIGQRWLCHELMCKLVEQNELPERTPDLLMAIYNDRHQDDIVRDYALQHMATACKKTSAAHRALLRKTLWAATRENQSTHGATALLALAEVSRQPGGEDAKKVRTKARQMAEDGSLSDGARATSLLVCAELGEEGVVPLALELAADEAAGPLRVAAIGALGVLHVEEARPLLEQLAGHHDTRLVRAAQSALTRFDAPRRPVGTP